MLTTQKNRIKSVRYLCAIAAFALIALVAPFYSVSALSGSISQSCQINTDCGSLSFIDYKGTQQTSISLKCISNRCVIPKQFVAIGTWCSTGIQCEDDTSSLQFTCNTNNSYCVGAVNQVGCIDQLARLNKDALIGTVGTTIAASDRCATGLVCDTVDTGECVNDFGQGKVPSDKLGETANDIRDQIRNLINVALGFLGVAGVIVTMYGGALWMSAAGDDEKVEKAKKTIVSGIIGLVIIGISWTIVSYVLTVTQSIA